MVQAHQHMAIRNCSLWLVNPERIFWHSHQATLSWSLSVKLSTLIDSTRYHCCFSHESFKE